MYLPVFLYAAYIVLTYVAFVCGIFEWPLDTYAYVNVSLFMFGVLMSLITGMSIGIKLNVGKNHFNQRIPFEKENKISYKFNYLCIGLIVLNVLSVYFYTGKSIIDIFYYAMNPKHAYETTLQFEIVRDSSMLLYKYSAILLAPLYYSIIPVTLIYWEKMRKSNRIFAGLFVISIIAFSSARGTDRELGEMVIFVFSSLMVKLTHSVKMQTMDVKKIWRAVCLFVLLVIIFIAIFSFRKYERLNGNCYFCILDFVCVNQDSIFNVILPDYLFFTLSILVAYISQGYYGLALALNSSSDFSYFVGHSLFLTKVVGGFFDKDLQSATYLGKMNQLGWSDSVVWSSIYPWLASDMGFYLTIIFLFSISIIFGMTWKKSIQCLEFSSIMVFCFLSYGLIFSVANNQIALTPETYFAFLFWLAMYFCKRKFLK